MNILTNLIRIFIYYIVFTCLLIPFLPNILQLVSGSLIFACFAAMLNSIIAQQIKIYKAIVNNNLTKSNDSERT